MSMYRCSVSTKRIVASLLEKEFIDVPAFSPGAKI